LRQAIEPARHTQTLDMLEDSPQPVEIARRTPMNRYSQVLSVMGTVVDVTTSPPSFLIRCRSGDQFLAYVNPDTTTFEVLRNLDDLDNDRVMPPEARATASATDRLTQYVQLGRLLVVQGIYQDDRGKQRFDARRVCLLSSTKQDEYLFEETHWWLTQIARLADQWLDMLFDDRRNYVLDDFVKLYSTDLNILGLRTDDDIQECAVLARLIYGFSAAYLLTGQERYRKAAEAGVAFQQDAFRSLSHDGQYCFWAYGRRKRTEGTELLVPSQSPDDLNSVPLYEQIYALAGMTLYYRISLDPAVLEDIRRTLKAFKDFYRDDVARPGDPAFQGLGGFFSHIDYVTMRPDENLNPANNLKKNWNSVGDHIPAYLINLILAINPKPQAIRDDLDVLRQFCDELLRSCVQMILDHFVDKDSSVPYVNERFQADWTPDHSYSWQQNRAIIGHNFKIAWNLTRVAHYLRADEARSGRAPGTTPDGSLADRCHAFADKLARAMTEYGVDLVRGGCFDAVERNPANGLPVEFTWLNTKDFWQQEQAILAYLILYGQTRDKLYLELARETEAFWNLFFLDRPHRGMFFRVTENGVPITDPGYGVRGGHSDASGYHCFELNFLAHIYNRCYAGPETGTDSTFCLYFRPSANCGLRSINVLPDFLPPGRIKIVRIAVNGNPRLHFDPECFQIDLLEEDLGQDIVVEFCTCKDSPQMPAQTPAQAQPAGSEERLGPMRSEANMAGPHSPRGA
jgi:mannose/cellobiose epimerase-like protein (N-acyl-D-glucosamine 2-epimerase family)